MQRLVGPGAAETEAADRENASHLRHVPAECAATCSQHLPLVYSSDAPAAPAPHDEIPLVFVGHEACGHALENQVGRPSAAKNSTAAISRSAGRSARHRRSLLSCRR